MKRINYTSSSENLIGILLSISIGFALILFGSGRTNAQNREKVPATNFRSERIRVQQIYNSQIGVREKGVNAGPEVEKYLRYVNLPKGNPWCAAFVCWVFGEAGVSNARSGWSPDLFGEGRVIWSRGEPGTKNQESRLPPNAPNREQGTKSKDQGFPPSVPTGFSSKTSHINRTATRCAYPPLAGAGGGSGHLLPTTGDVFGLYFPEKKRIAHVGFIDHWDGTWMISVEGNTNVSGGREGDGVYRKRRLVRTVYKVARYVGR